jgi:hypothetical protein
MTPEAVMDPLAALLITESKVKEEVWVRTMTAFASRDPFSLALMSAAAVNVPARATRKTESAVRDPG